MTDVALALLRRGERWFLQRRDPGNPVLPGLWEFPGGKAEPGESAAQALARELREELGIVHRVAQPWPVIEGRVRLHPFLVEADGDPCTELAWGWFTPEELGRLPMPPLNAALARWLADARGGGRGTAEPI